ncbi:hypothetical protein Btru_077375 [Bulinus truncatus]|nr:hypothetical protein Btru_077375 [Bulinus truncatus]
MVNSGRNKSGQDISGMMYDTFEDLELFFESINKNCPELKRKNAPNQAAMQVVENVYKWVDDSKGDKKKPKAKPIATPLPLTVI